MSSDALDPGGQARASQSVGRVARSGMWSLLGYSISAGSALAVSVLVARSLGAEAFGRFAFFMWLLKLLPTLIAFGVPRALTRLIAEHTGAGHAGRAHALVRLVVRFHGALVVPTAVALGLFLHLAGAEPAVTWTLSVGMAIGLLALDVEGLLEGLRRFPSLTGVATTTALVQLTLTLAALATGVGWPGFLAAQVAGAGIGLVVGVRAARSGLVAVGDADPAPADRRRFVRFSGVLGVTIVIDAVLWGRPELLFIEWYATDEALGLYAAALRLTSFAVLIPLVASRALLPEFSWLRGGGHDVELTRVYPRVCRLLALVAAPLALGGAVVAGPLLVTVFGAEFAGGTTALQILFVGSIVNAVAGAATAIVLTGPRPRLVAEVGSVAAVANILLNFVLVPRLGIVGAAVANVSVQVVAVLIGVGYAWRWLGLRYPVGDVARIALVALAVVIPGGLVTQRVGGTVGLVAGISLAAVLYLPTLLVTGAVDRRELRRLLPGAPSEAGHPLTAGAEAR